MSYSVMVQISMFFQYIFVGLFVASTPGGCQLSIFGDVSLMRPVFCNFPNKRRVVLCDYDAFYIMLRIELSHDH